MFPIWPMWLALSTARTLCKRCTVAVAFTVTLQCSRIRSPSPLLSYSNEKAHWVSLASSLKLPCIGRHFVKDCGVTDWLIVHMRYEFWALKKKKKCSRVCVSLVDRVCVVSHTYGNSILVWPLWLQVFLFRLWSELSIHYSFYSKRNILTLSVVYFSWSLPMDIATLLKWKWKLTFSWSMNCECIFIKVKLKTLNRVILVVCVLSVLCLVVYMVQQSHLVAFLDSAGFITATAPVVYLFFPLVSISVVLQQLSNITHA